MYCVTATLNLLLKFYRCGGRSRQNLKGESKDKTKKTQITENVSHSCSRILGRGERKRTITSGAILHPDKKRDVRPPSGEEERMGDHTKTVKVRKQWRDGRASPHYSHGNICELERREESKFLPLTLLSLTNGVKEGKKQGFHDERKRKREKKKKRSEMKSYHSSSTLFL